MKKYTIDYEWGVAEFYTNEENKEKALEEFYDAANECFGIRKSIGDTEIKSVEDDEIPSYYNTENVTHALFHNGDSILFNNENGDWQKTKSEWD